MQGKGVSKKKKERLDVLTVKRGLFESRKEAQTAIMNGVVLVNDNKVTKPGTAISITDTIKLKAGFSPKRFVSRGGLKLEKALDQFDVSVKERICLDIGASTGGFSDCMLQRGAALIYAIDVGHGQLDWKVRSDPKVIVKEKCNARYLTAQALYQQSHGETGGKASFAAIDCSFISLAKILPILDDLLSRENRQVICLVKPQFEADRQSVKKGVVKDKSVHQEVLEKVATWSELTAGLCLTKSVYSPVKGPAGNIEYLVLLQTNGKKVEPASLTAMIDEAFDELNRQVETDTMDGGVGVL